MPELPELASRIYSTILALRDALGSSRLASAKLVALAAVLKARRVTAAGFDREIDAAAAGERARYLAVARDMNELVKAAAVTAATWSTRGGLSDRKAVEALELALDGARWRDARDRYRRLAERG